MPRPNAQGWSFGRAAALLGRQSVGHQYRQPRQVHPDTFWWPYTPGNARKRLFSNIWTGLSDPIVARLKARPRAIKGRLWDVHPQGYVCRQFPLRALLPTSNTWAEDPAYYLSDHNFGTENDAERVVVTPPQGV